MMAIILICFSLSPFCSSALYLSFVLYVVLFHFSCTFGWRLPGSWPWTCPSFSPSFSSPFFLLRLDFSSYLLLILFAHQFGLCLLCLAIYCSVQLPIGPIMYLRYAAYLYIIKQIWHKQMWHILTWLNVE